MELYLLGLPTDRVLSFSRAMSRLSWR